MAFKGFSPKIRDFFSDLHQNNNKEWFQEHKSFYETEIKATSQALVESMSAEFAKNCMSYIGDKKKSLFRINRDIRFSKDKSPYKTNLGVFFPYSSAHIDVKDPETMGLYLHVDHQEIFVAGGLHMPDGKGLLSIRTRILEDWEHFKSILNNKTFKKEFPHMNFSNSTKLIPKGFPKDFEGEKWLKLKDFTPHSYLAKKDLESEALIQILIEKAKAIAPFNEFLRISLESF